MKKYKFLKTACVIFKVLSWLVLSIMMIVGLMVLITGAPIVPPGAEQAIPAPRAAGVVFMITGIFYFLLLYTISEIIALLLDIKGVCVCDKKVETKEA